MIYYIDLPVVRLSVEAALKEAFRDQERIRAEVFRQACMSAYAAVVNTSGVILGRRIPAIPMMIGTIIAEELTSVGAYDCEIDGGVEYLWERGSFERKHLTGGEQSPDPGLDAMTYTDYLKSPAWQAIRQHALWAADWVCALCGTDQSLNVHHKWYPARGAETVKDLIVLCKPCHAKHHGKEA